MFWVVLGNALFIFALRVASVAMSTVRTVLTVRGLRIWSALIGFVEVTIWVLAISQVINDLDKIWNLIGYSGGFAAGTLLGMWIEDKMAIGQVEITIVTMGRGLEVVDKVRHAGFGATMIRAEGLEGPVQILRIVAERKQAKDVIRLTNEVDATAFVNVEDARKVLRGYRTLTRPRPQ